jgi:chemotaxis protein CheX
VVIGRHKVSYPSGIPIVSIPCTVEKGQMMIEVAIKETVNT